MRKNAPVDQSPGRPEPTGAQGGNRTRDLRITSALLYRLSYLGAEAILGAG